MKHKHCAVGDSMRTLTLALKGEYFDDIKSGKKLEEFRLAFDDVPGIG